MQPTIIGSKMGQMSVKNVLKSKLSKARVDFSKKCRKSTCVSGSYLSPKILLPVYKTDIQMKGKVQGLPVTVPIAAARTLPRMNQAIMTARMQWRPKKGVNVMATPQAKPAAIDCGVPFRLFRRFNKFCHNLLILRCRAGRREFF